MQKTKRAAKMICFVMAVFILTVLFVKAANQKKVESTSSDLRLKGYETFQKMRETSIFKNLKWRFIGPDIISIRCTDVDVPKGSKHTIYVGSATGGLWKTVNSGITWEPIMDDVPSTSIGDVAVDQNDANIVWVGTGEANIFRASVSGTGIYKSSDAGKSWKLMGLKDSGTIARIVIHPKNSDVVYVAVPGHEWTRNEERGIFKTTDGGKNWAKVFFINDYTGAADLVMDPENPDTLWASMWNRTRQRWSDPRPGPGDGIFKTTNGGKTWVHKTTSLPDNKLTGRIGLDVARSNPNVIYAFVDNHNPGRMPNEGERDAYGRLKTGSVIKGAEVYRSENKGETWKKVSPDNRYMEGFGGTYGWVFGQMRVDPNDENTLYIMGLRLAKSTDGGKSWKTLFFPGLHGDHHGLWIDPTESDYLINVNDGGVNVSYDGGATWRDFHRNFPAAQFYNVSIDMQDPFYVYGSVQDHNTHRGPISSRPAGAGRRSLRTSLIWERAPGGEGTMIAIDPTDSNTVYSSSFYGRLMRSELKDGQWTSKNILPKVGEGEPPLRGQWLTPTILSPHNPKVVYHGMQYVFRSEDKGETWERISGNLTHNDPKTMGELPFAIPFHCLTALSESPFEYGLLYAGSDDGRVHVTKDGGKNWMEITSGLPYYKHVSRLVTSKYDKATVYVTLNGRRDDDMNDYIYKSTDYGRTWVDISANIPCGPVNVIREDPKNEGILYVGTDFGVFASIDGGQSYHVVGQNLPSSFVWDLKIHPRDNVLVIATNGRGMWVVDNISAVQNKKN